MFSEVRDDRKNDSTRSQRENSYHIPLNEIDLGKLDGNIRLPDFYHSWEYAGQLLEEMYQMNLHIYLRFRNKSNVDTEFSHGHYENDRCGIEVSSSHGELINVTIMDDLPTAAICLAYLEVNK